MSYIKINSFSEFQTLRQEGMEAKRKFGFNGGGVSSFICPEEPFSKDLMGKLFEAFPEAKFQVTADEKEDNIFILKNFQNNFPTLYITLFSYSVNRITYKTPTDGLLGAWVTTHFCGDNREEMINDFIKKLKEAV